MSATSVTRHSPDQAVVVIESVGDTARKIVVDDRMTLIRLAVAGLGLAYVSEMEVAEELAARTLVPVLREHITPSAGLFLYFPARTQDQPKLRAFIDVLRRKTRTV